MECIFVTLFGVVDGAELLEAQKILFEDPAFRGEYSRLIDASQCDYLAIDGVTVYYVSKSAERRGLKRAALVANNSVQFGLMRMYEGYNPSATCEVFRDVATAIKWLAPPPVAQ